MMARVDSGLRARSAFSYIPSGSMASHPPRMKVTVDGDGVRTHRASGLYAVGRVLIPTGVLVGVAVVLAIVVIRREPVRAAREPVRVAEAPAAPAAAPTTPKPAAAAPEARVRPVRRTAAPAAPATDAAAAPGAAATPPPKDLNARDVIPMLREAGETGGIAAFPPPGTKPVKRGIVVPDDFVLPEGYVRHYQTTDEGQQLEPILMFHPDYVLVDASGNPVPLPENRVVPPELAPPGLTIRMLDLPDPDRAP
jgi:hypothetical protein